MSIKNLYTPIILGDTSNEFTDKINTNFNTTKEDVQFLFENLGKIKLEPATTDILGGIKASPKTSEETVEVKIGLDNKLYVPESGLTEIPQATETELGGIKASFKTDNETEEIKIGPDNKLYGPKAGIAEIPLATEIIIGGIKASPKTDNETSEIKIGLDGKLYGPVIGGPASKLKIIDINVSDWVDNEIIITPEQHKFGDTLGLLIFTLMKVDINTYVTVYDSPSITTDGIITLTTRHPWEGKVLISGGSGGGTGDITEVWKAIEDIKETIETLEIVISII